jgi:hypothetical protein
MAAIPIASLRQIAPNGRTLVGRPNVRLSAQGLKISEEAFDKMTFLTHSHIYAALSPLTYAKSDWVFHLCSVVARSLRDGETYESVVVGVRITAHGNLLGTINIVRRGDNYVLKVENTRISDTRERGDGYHTSDPDKAALKIRRMFYPQLVSEKLETAQVAAVRSLQVNVYDKRNAVHRIYTTEVEDRMKVFVAQNKEMFLASLAPEHVLHAEDYFAKDESLSALMLLQEAKELWGRVSPTKDKAMLVVLDGGVYIVKCGDDVLQYTSNNVPFDVSSRVGMLKLVEEGKYVDNMGIKVTQDIFLLHPTI